jgi:hypothetical protein
MLYEIYMSQTFSIGGYFTVVDRSALGYDLPSEQKKTKGKSDQKALELETLLAAKREKSLNRNRYEKHNTFSNMFCLLFVTAVIALVFALIGTLSFELPDCPINTYDNGNGVCADCLTKLGTECAECSSKTKCDKCKDGFMQDVSQNNLTICTKCQVKHGDQCDLCETDNCLNCIGNNFLDTDGKCKDCVS